MELQFEVKSADKCSKRDILSALDIYCKSVDPGSMTDTNQIKDYIKHPIIIKNKHNYSEITERMLKHLYPYLPPKSSMV